MNKEILATPLFKDISQLIESAKAHVASYANSALVILYWQIGKLINEEVLKSERAEYGEQVIKQLSQQLKQEYGSGFDKPNISRMTRFARLYPNQPIVVTLSQQLAWSHFAKLVSIEIHSSGISI